MISRHLRGRSAALSTRVEAEIPIGLATCAIVEAELRYGLRKASASPMRSATLERLLAVLAILPFDSEAAKVYGDLRAHLGRAGTMIGGNDLMIAAIALAGDLTLVTHNVTEFARVPNLRIEDWEA